MTSFGSAAGEDARSLESPLTPLQPLGESTRAGICVDGVCELPAQPRG